MDSQQQAHAHSGSGGISRALKEDHEQHRAVLSRLSDAGTREDERQKLFERLKIEVPPPCTSTQRVRLCAETARAACAPVLLRSGERPVGRLRSIAAG
jgi:hypothetical protein